MSEVRQREPRLEVPKLRASAEGEECTLRVPGICSGRTDTVVWCHSPFAGDKGIGMKAHDTNGCFGCQPCHTWLDSTRGPDRDGIFQTAKDRTYYQLFKSGKVKVVR